MQDEHVNWLKMHLYRQYFFFRCKRDEEGLKYASNKAKMDKIDAKAKKIIDYGVI